MTNKRRGRLTEKDAALIREKKGRLSAAEIADLRKRGVIPTADEDAESVKQIEARLPEILERGRQLVKRELELEDNLKSGWLTPMSDVMAMLRVARHLKGIRLEDVEKSTGISNTSLSKLERGQGNPTIETIQRVASALGVNVMITVKEILPSPDEKRLKRATEILGRMNELVQRREIASPEFSELAHKLETLNS